MNHPEKEAGKGPRRRSGENRRRMEKNHDRIGWASKRCKDIKAERGTSGR